MHLKNSLAILNFLLPAVIFASEQPLYEVGDSINISDFKTVARLQHALVWDNELAKRCLNEEKRGKEVAQKVARQSLKENFAPLLDQDFFRESIDQELALSEERMLKKNNQALTQSLTRECEPLFKAVAVHSWAEKCSIDAQQEIQMEHAHTILVKKVHRFMRSPGLAYLASRNTHTAKIVTYHLPPSMFHVCDPIITATATPDSV